MRCEAEGAGRGDGQKVCSRVPHFPFPFLLVFPCASAQHLALPVEMLCFSTSSSAYHFLLSPFGFAGASETRSSCTCMTRRMCEKRCVMLPALRMYDACPPETREACERAKARCVEGETSSERRDVAGNSKRLARRPRGAVLPVRAMPCGA